MYEEPNGQITAVGSFRESFSGNSGNLVCFFSNGQVDYGFQPDFVNPDASYVSVQKVSRPFEFYQKK
ncbi:MAG: delta-60 repeat domain-containing protein [Bacteroidota bacterium]